MKGKKIYVVYINGSNTNIEAFMNMRSLSNYLNIAYHKIQHHFRNHPEKPLIEKGHWIFKKTVK